MKNNNPYKIKIILIVLSILIVLYTLTGDIIGAEGGGRVPLYYFESFYVYLFTTIISIIMAKNNKNPNIMILMSILTYGWTYYLMISMMDIIEGLTITNYYFYIYLSSTIFLIIALFINKKEETPEQENTTTTENNFN